VQQTITAVSSADPFAARFHVESQGGTWRAIKLMRIAWVCHESNSDFRKSFQAILICMSESGGFLFVPGEAAFNRSSNGKEYEDRRSVGSGLGLHLLRDDRWTSAALEGKLQQ
jgi:hypothetical protein